MPEFKLVDEAGTWLTDILGVPDWKPGDRINRGQDTLEVVEVRADDEKPVLVVCSERSPNSN